MKKKLVIALVSMLIMLSFQINAYANNIGILSMDRSISNAKMIEISSKILASSTDDIQSLLGSNSSLFTEYEKEELLKTNSRIQKIDGDIEDCEVMYTTYKNSSTVDTVIAVDMKISDGKYNRMVLIEYHINKDGKIYGHNIWVY